MARILAQLGLCGPQCRNRAALNHGVVIHMRSQAVAMQSRSPNFSLIEQEEFNYSKLYVLHLICCRGKYLLGNTYSEIRTGRRAYMHAVRACPLLKFPWSLPFICLSNVDATDSRKMTGRTD